MDLKALQKKYDLTDLEVFTQDSSNHKISFIANKLKQTESVHSTGKALRLINKKKIGFTANYTSEKNSIEETINQALEVSRFSPEVDFELPLGKRTGETAERRYGETENIISKFKSKGQEIIETILSQAPNVLTDVSFDMTSFSENLENSRDLKYSHSKELYSFSINIRETLENDFIDIYTAVVDSNLPEHKNYLDEILRFYSLTKKHAKIKSGKCPVLFTSKAGKELLSLVEAALSGKQINQKSSPWHNKLGEKVLSSLLTLRQDPKIGYMAREFDDEGSIVKPLNLINNGILENFYYDLSSACKSVTCNTSTGNGFKPSLTSQPEPTLLNVIVSNGKRSLDEIIKNIDYGLLVDQTMGGLTTNISGDMSVNVDLGFLIEKGELVGRVKDTMVSGNIYTALNNVLELSNYSKWYWSNIYNPDMLVDGLTITTV